MSNQEEIIKMATEYADNPLMRKAVLIAFAVIKQKDQAVIDFMTELLESMAKLGLKLFQRNGNSKN